MNFITKSFLIIVTIIGLCLQSIAQENPPRINISAQKPG